MTFPTDPKKLPEIFQGKVGNYQFTVVKFSESETGETPAPTPTPTSSSSQKATTTPTSSAKKDTAKTSITLKVTKKKTYYIRVRAYKGISKNYGKWSAVKKVKVKK